MPEYRVEKDGQRLVINLEQRLPCHQVIMPEKMIGYLAGMTVREAPPQLHPDSFLIYKETWLLDLGHARFLHATNRRCDITIGRLAHANLGGLLQAYAERQGRITVLEEK